MKENKWTNINVIRFMNTFGLYHKDIGELLDFASGTISKMLIVEDAFMDYGELLDKYLEAHKAAKSSLHKKMLDYYENFTLE